MNDYNPYSLRGKTVLVTGASSGIGQTTAVECSKMGATVIITGRNVDKLNDTLSKMEGAGHSLIIADLSSEEDIDRLVDELPKIDGLVNNAGFNIMSPIPFLTSEKANSMIGVNLTAPILVIQKIVKKKKLSKNSSVVFTSSISGIGCTAPGNSIYSATKGGLNAFMKNAALELSAKGIRCNSVCPGMVETPLKEGKSSVTEEQWEINRQLYPLKRFGKPEDIAYAIIYLLSDASSWMTGSEIIIDGGRTLK